MLVMGPRMHELPPPLRPSSLFPFVGRASELATLHALLPTAEGEGGRVVLLGGEPGSGKSRLVRELAARAMAEGALVLYGACDAVVHPPFGPFAEALERLRRVVDADELRTALENAGPGIARLLPELRDQPQRTASDPDTERHRLHTAVANLLDAVARRRPVLLVLEDCHWADGASL